MVVNLTYHTFTFGELIVLQWQMATCLANVGIITFPTIPFILFCHPILTWRTFLHALHHLLWFLFPLWSPFLVLGSLVQSSFSSIFEKTRAETGPPFLKFSKTKTRTVIDQSTAISCSFLQLQDWSEPVTVQTSLQPVPDRPCT